MPPRSTALTPSLFPQRVNSIFPGADRNLSVQTAPQPDSESPVAGAAAISAPVPKTEQSPPGNAVKFPRFSRFEREESIIAARVWPTLDAIRLNETYTFTRETIQKQWAAIKDRFVNRYGVPCNRGRAKLLFDLHLVTALAERFPRHASTPRNHARQRELTKIVKTF